MKPYLSFQINVLTRSVFSIFMMSVSTFALEKAEQPQISFNETIQPILSANCYHCHGPASSSRKSNFRIDREEYAFQPPKSGEVAIVKGDAEKSEIFRRITTKDSNEIMPPPEEHKKLKPEEIEALRQWINQGAKYEEHWAFVPPKRPNTPSVKNKNWIKNPIDAFVLSTLEKKGLTPEAEASQQTLIRRVTLTLTGLPPTPEEVEKFVNDKDPQAYEKYVEKILASPRYGEHMTRYWLDAARYGDTHGLHWDNYREMWPYRDYVIESFNQNKPFDKFTIEQLAGDMLPSSTIKNKIASGFLRCGPSTNEGGTIPEEVLATYTRERMETVSTVYLGMTMGCAYCHDHKLEPITQKETYSFAAFFNNSTQLAGDKNIRNTPPFIYVYTPAEQKRLEEITKEIEPLNKSADEKVNHAFENFPAFIEKLNKKNNTFTLPKPIFNLSLTKTNIEAQAPVSGPKINFGKSPKFEEGIIESVPLLGKEKAIIENLPASWDQSSFVVSGWFKINAKKNQAVTIFSQESGKSKPRWELAFHKLEDETTKLIWRLEDGSSEGALDFEHDPFLELDPPFELNSWIHLAFSYDHQGKSSTPQLAINGVAQEFKGANNYLKKTLSVTGPLLIGGGEKLKGGSGLTVQSVRIDQGVLDPSQISALVLNHLAKEASKISPKNRTKILYLTLPIVDDELRPLFQKITTLNSEKNRILEKATTTLVMEEKNEPPFAFVLDRGDYSKPLDKVSPDVPHVLPGFNPATYSANRLGLAQWLVSDQNPTTARVTVNRFWQQVFGTGIVVTSENFGVAGDRPLNQPLLDWLAVEFKESGWDVKKIMKTMVTSAAFRQQSKITPEKIEKDPQNLYLSRGPRFRMDGETLRDQVLFASGLMNHTIGGPSVKPYQPKNIWEAVAYAPSNTRIYKQDQGPSLYRRSVYTFLKRQATHPALEMFGTPNRETCTVRRERTNTPLQALVMMNDPQIIEGCRQMAANAVQTSGNDFEKIINDFSIRLLARPFKEEEKTSFKKTYAELAEYYQKNPELALKLIQVGDSKAPEGIPPHTLATWTVIASVVVNLDEALNL